MAYVTKKSRDMVICAGDLNKRITIYNRTITPPSGDSVDYSEVFSVPVTVYAMVETIKGTQLFDGTNLTYQSTHRFTIRYQKNLEIDIQKWVEYGGKKYKIVDVQNQNELNRFYIITANERGFDNLPVNFQ